MSGVMPNSHSEHVSRLVSAELDQTRLDLCANFTLVICQDDVIRLSHSSAEELVSGYRIINAHERQALRGERG